MDKHGKKNKMNNTKIRCQFSDEPVGHKPVVLVKNAVLYLRKAGYIVSNKPIFLIFLLSIIFLPIVSADTIYNNSFFVSSAAALPNAIYYNSVFNFSAGLYNNTYLYLNGSTNNYVNVSLFDPKIYPSWTISLWVNMTTSNSGKCFVGIGNRTSANNYICLTQSSGGYFKVNMVNGSGTTTAPSGAINLTNSGWHFLTLTYYSENLTRLFVDGNQDGSSMYFNISTIFGFTHTNIGAIRTSSFTNFYNGNIKDVRFYNGSMINAIVNATYLDYTGRLSFPVIYYHEIDDNNTSNNVNVTEFDKQMNFLYTNGFHPITVTNFYNWRIGNFTMPSKPIIIEFDDGKRNVITNATPIMDKYGFVGNFNVITEFMGTPDYSTWTDLRGLLNKGWDINSHTYDHTNMSARTYAQRQEEFNRSKNEIIGNLSFTPIYFAFPLNERNLSLDIECLNYYKICSGLSNSVYTYIYNFTNSSNGLYFRILVGNNTPFSASQTGFVESVNQYPQLVYEYNLNENSGSVAYDSSNGNNGVISGGFWRSDGVYHPLLYLSEYSLNGDAIFSFLKTFYRNSLVYFYYTVVDYNPSEPLEFNPNGQITYNPNGAQNFTYNPTYPYPFNKIGNKTYNYNNASNLTLNPNLPKSNFTGNNPNIPIGGYNPSTSPASNINYFKLDFANTMTVAIFYILFAASGLLFFMRYYMFAGGLISVLGLTLLFSGFIPLLSFIIIVGGVLCIFVKV